MEDRRVRTAPGGKDSLAEGLFGDADNTEFKPTRRCVGLVCRLGDYDQ